MYNMTIIVTIDFCYCAVGVDYCDSWVSSTFIMNNSAMGVAAPGSGNGASASSMDGMVV